jgi:hypothetical protein
MPKKFSPIRINNPTSLQQIVKIGPGQEICMYLDNEIFGEHAVDVSTDTLLIDSKNYDNGRLYTISHPTWVHEWADFSSVMLGEIWIDGKKSIGKVGVLLESTNTEKLKVRTAINPDCMDMRMYPYNVLEVIVFDNRFGYHDEWSYEWKPTKDRHVGIESIGYDHLCLQSWEAYYNGLEPANYLYARYPRGEPENGLLTRQHHFWFRLNCNAFAMVAQETSIVHIGNIIINGISNKYQLQYAEKTSYHLSLYIDCRKKCYRELQETFNLKLRNESSPQKTGIILHKEPYKYTPPPKIVLPEIRDVDIRLVGTGDVSDCKTLLALNENYKSTQQFDEDWEPCDLLDDCHHASIYPRRKHHHPKWWRKWH